MNANNTMIQRVPWVAALLLATAMAAPASAGEVTEEIRSQGREAIDAMRADIRPSLSGIDIPSAARDSLSVDESIRIGGRVAMRSMARDLDPARVAPPVAPPEMLDRQGLVTVNAYEVDGRSTDSESL